MIALLKRMAQFRKELPDYAQGFHDAAFLLSAEWCSRLHPTQFPGGDPPNFFPESPYEFLIDQIQYGASHHMNDDVNSEHCAIPCVLPPVQIPEPAAGHVGHAAR